MLWGWCLWSWKVLTGIARCFVCGLLALVLCATSSATAAERPRGIVSINACTDQLLFKLADRDQIAALSAFAADPGYSPYAAEVKASGIPLIGGSAEEVLKLKPSLVLAGAWTRSATREHLKSQGIVLAEFAPDESVAATIDAIRKVAQLTGHEDRGVRMITDIEAAFAAATPPANAQPLSALQVQRRGFTSGRDTLTGELLRRLGIANAADKLGITGVAEVPLEAILTAKPDVLIVLQPRIEAADQGAALLLHPALMKAYPPERRILLPNLLTACGGPALADAVRELARGLQRVPR